MKALIDLINAKYHPGTRTFCHVPASEIVQELGISPSELDEMWDEVETALEQNNLLILPALPDAKENEDVRIFRRDAPLARVLVEALFPTPEGNALLVGAITALNPQRRQAATPKRGHKQQNGGPKNHQQGGQRRKHQRGKPEGSLRDGEIPDATKLSSRAHYTRPLV